MVIVMQVREEQWTALPTRNAAAPIYYVSSSCALHGDVRSPNPRVPSMQRTARPQESFYTSSMLVRSTINFRCIFTGFYCFKRADGRVWLQCLKLAGEMMLYSVLSEWQTLNTFFTDYPWQ